MSPKPLKRVKPSRIVNPDADRISALESKLAYMEQVEYEKRAERQFENELEYQLARQRKKHAGNCVYYLVLGMLYGAIFAFTYAKKKLNPSADFLSRR